ncbi:tetratricopeptide repeat protein [Arhodomonas sp. SL1]|uniref:tetratricopeptide repeat protein n=1 Tax=Arhodomonas sp. SL1 TaxID=3425691 RepID=UPI003F884AC3
MQWLPRSHRRSGLWLLLVALLASARVAADGPHDYYAGDAPPGLLENARGYHLTPAERKLERGAYRYAMQDARFILGRFPNDPIALALAARIALAWPGHARDAVTYFERAVALFPQYAETWLLCGLYHERLGELDTARTAYRHALERDPGLARARERLEDLEGSRSP